MHFHAQPPILESKDEDAAAKGSWDQLYFLGLFSLPGIGFVMSAVGCREVGFVSMREALETRKAPLLSLKVPSGAIQGFLQMELFESRF